LALSELGRTRRAEGTPIYGDSVEQDRLFVDSDHKKESIEQFAVALDEPE
jgi:hypothetical protein